MGQSVKKTLLGKEFIFSESMDSFNSLRKKYLMLSAEAREKAQNAYRENVYSYAAYMKNCRALMDEIFEEYLQIGVLDIIQFGIYDIDEVVLRHELMKEYGISYAKTISEFTSTMDQIDEEQKEAEAERAEAVRDTRLVDATYVASTGDATTDLANVIGSKLQAGLMNGIAKGGTALLAAGVGALERKAAENNKTAIFNSRDTEEGIEDGIERDVYILHRTVARLTNERTGVEHYCYTHEEDAARFEPVCRNILRGNFNNGNDKTLEIQQIHNVVKVNPYDLRIYGYIISEYGGMTAELLDLMDYLFVDKPELVSSYLETKYDLNDYKVYEEIVEFEKTVITEMSVFEITACEYFDDLLKKKERLYIERRTFHQYTYDTIEERDLAEKQYDDFVGDGFDEMDLDSLLERDNATYEQDLLETNKVYIRQELLFLIEMAVEKFKDSDSLSIYVLYAKNKKKEHQLVEYAVLNVIEKKYKKLVRKEKIEAKVADIKGKIIAFFKNFKSSLKRFWQKITIKLPFGKLAKIGKVKDTSKKKKAKNRITAAEVATVPAVEAVQKVAIVPAVEATPEVAVAPVVQTAPEVVAAPVVQAAPEVAAAPVVQAAPEVAVAPVVQAAPEVVVAPVVDATPEVAETPVVEAPEVVVEAVAPVTPVVETKDCPQCGNTLKAAAKFCSKCGYRF